MSFLGVLEKYPWERVRAAVYSKTAADVRSALTRAAAGGARNLDDMLALLSPAAAPFLEEIARLAHERTLRRFGRTVQLFAPLYVSNECHNVCTYCGFSFGNAIPRKILTDAELLAEAAILKRDGFDHVLVVSGESGIRVGAAYFERALRLLRPLFSSISLEVQPLKTEEYARLRNAGLSAVLVYQETYDRDGYRKHHLKGPKANFEYRLETPERIGAAGINKIGLGALYGLEDWRVDSFFTALHLDYLERVFWRSRYSVSFPRLRPHAGGLQAKVEMTQRDLAQALCAFRLFDPEVEISVSTREPPVFRDNAMFLGATTMSAGAKTNPGGYAAAEAGLSREGRPLEQFHASDERPPAEVTAAWRAKGYEPVWKDWDSAHDAPDSARPRQLFPEGAPASPVQGGHPA
ncbi:MAG: 2-iminoacetate synthase ThiH [Puniceicoccales bacterium]|jgi:2-iminoacetate synthase|nr:2-iminoacetate synthase ThiH [Puniceicoccales bacterium]